MGRVRSTGHTGLPLRRPEDYVPPAAPVPFGRAGLPPGSGSAWPEIQLHRRRAALHHRKVRCPTPGEPAEHQNGGKPREFREFLLPYAVIPLRVEFAGML